MDSEQYRPGKYRGGWAAVIGRGNNKRRIQIGAGSKQDAEAFCRRLNAKLEFERRGRGPITIDRILDLYINDRRAQGTVNVARIEEVRRSIKPLWGTYHPDDLDTKTQREYITRRRRRGLSDATTRQELAYLQAALNLAERSKLIDKAPRLEKPPAPRPRDPRSAPCRQVGGPRSPDQPRP